MNSSTRGLRLVSIWLGKQESTISQVRFEVHLDILKAAGTPMIKALPEPISVERLTLAPGFPSVSSMLGIESPTWTIFAIGGVYRVAVCFEVYSN